MSSDWHVRIGYPGLSWIGLDIYEACGMAWQRHPVTMLPEMERLQEMMKQRFDLKRLCLVHIVIKIAEFRFEQHLIDDLIVPKPGSRYYQQRYHQPCSKKDF
jgi:hypothetical protein